MSQSRLISTRSSFARYTVAVGATLAIALLRWLLAPLLGDEQPIVLFTLGITLAGWFGGFGPGLVATALSVIIGIWAFIPPIYSFEMADVSDITRLVILVVLGITVSFISESMHRAARKSRERENDLRQSTHRLDALAESAGLMLRKESPEAVVDELCRKVMDALGCQMFLNYLLDEKSGRLRLNAHAGVPEKALDSLKTVNVGDTVCGCVARDKQPLTLNVKTIKADDRAAMVRSVGIKAYACHPMIVGERPLGTISFGTSLRDEFSPDDLSLMRAVADHVAIALQRKLNREALLASEERYRAFISTSLEAIWRIEFDEPVDTRLASDAQVRQIFERGYYAEANDALARLYGWTRAEEVVGLRVKDTESIDDEPTRASYRQFIEAGYKRSGEVSLERDRNGGTKHFLNSYVGIVENGRLVRIWGSSLDVTEEHNTERELRKQTALLLGVSASVTDLVYAKDLESRITLANPATLKVIGKPGNEVVGRSDIEWGDIPEQGKAIRENDLQVFKEGRPMQFEERFKTRIYESFKSPLRDNNGTLIGLVGVSRDVTDRKEAEEQLLAAKAAAEAANKAKDDFLAALSHELRTPLTPVLFLAGEAVKNQDLEDDHREDWLMVQKNISLLARLIDDLLDLTRIARGKLSLQCQPIDAHTVINDAVNMVRSGADSKRLKLTVDLEARNRQILGDGTRLQQVFGNILQNAVKFTPSGGAIFVQTRNSDDGKTILVEIADTGMGLTPEEMERIFGTFSQGEHATNRSTVFGGLGLGLAIARELLQLHKGRITASSAGRNRGAIFTVELPVLNSKD